MVSSLWGGIGNAGSQLAVYVNEEELLQNLIHGPAVGHYKLSTGHKGVLRPGQFKHKKNK